MQEVKMLYSRLEMSLPAGSDGPQNLKVDASLKISSNSEPSREEDLLHTLLRIRDFESALLELFSLGELSGTTHTCLGQEHVPVALMPLLSDDDFVFSNHRGHGHYLARFDDYHGLLAEIMGRDSGICRGVGGSQHIRRGNYFSTGVQGESVPVACGCAWQKKAEGGNGLALAFIGDGTWGQGAVYEALNMASLWSLPLVIAVENNEISQTTSSDRNLAGTIRDRVAAFGVDYLCIKIVDVLDMREQIIPFLEQTRQERTPLVIEFKVSRLGPHSKGDDTRNPATLERLEANGWESYYRAKDSDRFSRLELHSKEFIDALIEQVKNEPLSEWQAK
ncbi:MAG: thiamine pyrophosphate-dependent dehydrogenase E1 component subunit alpha [Verrucomicrobiales bacterium]|nr:thiamine pyrophosphate-dependent dehydrogenase E1 component subunit alpha [Verrucomicrobiales bacterium]